MPTKTHDGEKAVHRALRRGRSGPDVSQFQHGINHKAAAWKLPQFTVDVDGELGELTESAAENLLYAIGAVGEPMKRARRGDFSEYAQRLLRGTRPRTKAMKVASVARRPKVKLWRKGGLRERAYQIASSLVGVMEEGGNNTGRKVSEIILSNGGYVGEPWCGDFVAYCYRNAGSKAVTRAWASVSLLGAVLGVRTTSHPQRGDIVRYSFDHTGLFVRWLEDGNFEAIEGNTGATGAVSDSKTGGDGVYRKVRHISQVNNFREVTR